MTAERSAIIAAGFTSVMWGATGIFVRLLPALSPYAVTAGRLLVAMIFILPLLLLSENSRLSLKLVVKNPIANVLALLLVGYYLLATAAFQFAPVAEAALLLSTPPLFILLFRWLHGNKPTKLETSGALLAVVGLSLILLPKISFSMDGNIMRLIGDLLALCAACLTAIYAYVFRLLDEKGKAPDTIGVSILTFVEGSFILALIVSLLPSPIGVDTLNEYSLFILICLGVFSTALPSIGFALASKNLPPIITATISLFIPLFAGIFAYLVLAEKPSPMFIPGCVLVLGGVIMILRKPKIKQPSFS